MKLSDAEAEAQELVDKLGEGWYSTIYKVRAGAYTYVVMNTDLDIYIRSRFGKLDFRCEFSDGVGAYGESPAAAMRNLAESLTNTAQQLSNLSFKLILK